MNKHLLILSMLLGACALPVSQKDVLSSLEPGDAGQSQGGDAGCQESNLTSWPVKVLFLVDNRGSLCIIDPPGAQAAGSGFCQQLGMPGGITVPGRVNAMEKFWAAHATQPNVWGAVTWWAPGPRGFSFQPVSSGFPKATAAELTTQLGTAMDLQGGLGLVKEQLEADLQASEPSLRARTKYLVVVISSGVPFPLCSANDSATSYATPANPEGLWADSQGSGDFCNVAPSSACDPLRGTDSSGQVCIPGFVAGGERNQPAALYQQGLDIAALRTTYGVGEISVHTRLLFDRSKIDACGPICQDLLGMPPSDALSFGTYVLQRVASAGGGRFVNPGVPQQLDLSDLDMTSLRPTCR